MTTTGGRNILRLGAGNDCNSVRKRFKTMSVSDAVYRHPDKGGDAALFAELLDAWHRAQAALCAPGRPANARAWGSASGSSGSSGSAGSAGRARRATRPSVRPNSNRRPNSAAPAFAPLNPMARFTPPTTPFFVQRPKRSFEPYKGLRPRAGTMSVAAAAAAAAARR